MKFFLVHICLLSTLISKGYSLTCISCTGVSQTPCTGSAITCPSSANTCSSIYTETRIAAFRETTYTIVRGCGYSSECDQPKRLSNQFMTVDINISCCKDDNCTPTSPKVSTDNAASNGLMCPSCFTVTSAACVKDGNIDCTGNQTKCTSYSMETTGEHSRPIVAMSGCATENLCSNYNGITSTSTTGEIKISIKCNNAKVSTGSQNDTSHSSTVSPYGNSASVSVNRPVMTSVTSETITNSSSNRVTSQVSSGTDHFITNIANTHPSSNTTSNNNYTSHNTLTSTAFHTATHETTSGSCVCNGYINLCFIICLIVLIILPSKCLY